MGTDAPAFRRRRPAGREESLRMSCLHIVVRRNSKRDAGAYYSVFSQLKGTDDASDRDSQGNEEL